MVLSLEYIIYIPSVLETSEMRRKDDIERGVYNKRGQAPNLLRSTSENRKWNTGVLSEECVSTVAR